MSLLLAPLFGCATPGAERVERLLAQGRIDAALVVAGAGGQVGLLRRVALAILERAAGGDDASLRTLAFGALRRRSADVETVLDRLTRSGREATSVRARSELFARGHGGHEKALWRALDAPDGEVRAAAIAVLREEPPRRPARTRSLTLMDALSGDLDSRVRRAALGILAQARGPWDATRRRAIAEASRRDPLPYVRAAAVRALAKSGEEDLPALREALDDRDLGVRLAAISAIASAAPREAGGLLGPYLAGEPRTEAVEAAFQLARLGDTGAVDYVLAALGSLGAAGDSARAQAALAAGEIGGEKSKDALLRAVVDAPRESRLQIALALRRFGPSAQPAATRALETIAEDDDWLGVQALLALPANRRTTERLLALLEDGDVRTRVAIARSVSSRADGARIVRRALGDEGPVVRVAAADAALGLAP